MDGASHSLGSTYKKEYDALRGWYSDTLGKIDSEVMFKGLRKEPSAIGKFLVQSPESVADFKKFLGESIKRGVIDKKDAINTLNEVRSGYLNGLVKSDATFGEILTLGSRLRKKQDKELAIEVLGAPQYNRLMGILDTAKLVGEGVDHSARFGLVAAGKTSTALRTVGTLGAGAGAGAMSLPAAVAIITAPSILGKVAASAPKAKQWTKLSELLFKAQRAGDKELTRIALSRYTTFMDTLAEEEGEKQ